MRLLCLEKTRFLRLFGTVPRHSRAEDEIQFHPASTKFGDAASEVQQQHQPQPPPAVIIHPDTTIYNTYFLGYVPAGLCAL